MSALAPLAMSQTKEDLLNHLNLPPATYALMAKETDIAYKWLTADKRHLKDTGGKRNPPYDWSDISEKAKDEAMRSLAQSGDQYTSYYWNLAVKSDECVNWVARWFLYHKFRYRDGRNRNSEGKPRNPRSSKAQHHDHHSSVAGQGSGTIYSESYYNSSPATAGPSYQAYYALSGSQTNIGGTSVGQESFSPSTRLDDNLDGETPSSEYWDPVRDV